MDDWLTFSVIHIFLLFTQSIYILNDTIEDRNILPFVKSKKHKQILDNMAINISVIEQTYQWDSIKGAEWKCQDSRSSFWIVQALSCTQCNKASVNACAQVVSARKGNALHQEYLMNSDRLHLRGSHPVSGLTSAFQFFKLWRCWLVCRAALV